MAEESQKEPKPTATEKKTADRSPPAGVGRKLAIILPLVLLAGAGIWYWVGGGGNAAAAPGAEKTGIKSTLHLETFVLNLADPDQRAYLRVGIDLGLSRELKRDELVPVAA